MEYQCIGICGRKINEIKDIALKVSRYRICLCEECARIPGAISDFINTYYELCSQEFKLENGNYDIQYGESNNIV